MVDFHNTAPIALENNRLFLTSSYGVGAQFSNVNNLSFDILWENDESLSSQYNTPIFYDNYIFGIHGRGRAIG